MFLGKGRIGIAHHAIAYNADGNIWRASTSSYVTPPVPSTSIANYAITATGDGLGNYNGTLPSDAERWDLRETGSTFADSPVVGVGESPSGSSSELFGEGDSFSATDR